MDNKKFSFAIIAGGESRRFGSDKSLALLKGRPLLDWCIDLALKVSSDIMVISKSNDKYDNHRDGIRYVEDLYEQQCPLNGVVTALHHAKHDRVFILSADAPLVKPEIVLTIISNIKEHKVALPKIGGKLYPLIAAYSKSSSKNFAASLNKGDFRLTDAIIRLDPIILTEEDFTGVESLRKSFTNINTEDDLYRIDS